MNKRLLILVAILIVVVFTTGYAIMGGKFGKTTSYTKEKPSGW